MRPPSGVAWKTSRGEDEDGPEDADQSGSVDDDDAVVLESYEEDAQRASQRARREGTGTKAAILRLLASSKGSKARTARRL
jgi:hypothetical protein